MAILRIKQIKSTISKPETQKLTIQALGLGKLHRVVEFEDSPAIRGQINKVRHLIEVTEA